MTKTHFYILFLSQNTSQMATSLKLNNLGVRKLGNVFLRQVIEMGAKWRVGDGRSIRVFQDRWLTRNSGAGGGNLISLFGLGL